MCQKNIKTKGKKQKNIGNYKSLRNINCRKDNKKVKKCKNPGYLLKISRTKIFVLPLLKGHFLVKYK